LDVCRNMSVQQSELVLASDTPGIISADVQSSAVSDITKNCSSSDAVEHGDSETMQCQPAVLPGLKEEIPPVKGEITDADIMEKLEVKSADDVDAVSMQVMQPSALTSPQLMGMDVSEQLAVLHNTVRSLKMSNDELQQIVSDGMTKVGELEVALAESEARNKEHEQELAQMSSSTERVISDVALLSASLARISMHVDKPDEVKPTPATGDGDRAAAEGIDVASLLPAIEQRIGELELKVQQSVTRFGEFASALDSIERDLQRYVRRHSLVVENLSPKEDRSASDAFLIFVNSVLGVTVDDSDIDGYHLLDRTHEDGAAAANTHSPDKKKDIRPRPLLITFTCYRTRTQVYKVIFSTYCNNVSVHILRHLDV